MEQNNNITRKDLEEQTQILLGALDSRFNSMEKRLTGVMDARFSASAVRFDSVDKRIDEMETNLGEKIDKIQTQLDGDVNEQEKSKQEKVILDEEIKQMKGAFKDKLGVVISAA